EKTRMTIPEFQKIVATSSILTVLAFAVGCEPKKTAGGNYSSDAGLLLWTTNRDAPAPSTGPAVETFNIFMMDGNGGHRVQLTTDSWPVINQHPVFTSDSKRIVWAHGGVGHSSIWIMNVDGSAKAQVTAAPPDAEDGHPWAGSDGRIYFARHEHSSHVHKIWSVNLDGTGATELIGSGDKDRFHPNLDRGRNLILYTSSGAGAGSGDEIRVFDIKARQDRVLYAPGWPVSAAIWHPDGNRAVVAEDHNKDGKYRIVEISYPAGAVIRTLTDDAQDNTIPYYAYPSGAFVDWVQFPGGRRTRNIARMNADGTGKILLTNDAYENTKIVGEPDIIPATTPGGREHCKPRPVGCYPTPPPCEKVLLPDAVKSGAERLGRVTGQQGAAREVAPEGYLAFMREDLKIYLDRSQPRATQDLQRAAENLREFLSSQDDNEVLERVADIYVNNYLAALNR
ncbi:MAG TPA: DPP IV N-terminal domain-containing protein, partial [Bryobacteraceae bacterium]